MRNGFRLILAAAVAATICPPSPANAQDDGVERYLFASVHKFADFHQKKGTDNFHTDTKQGVFVYDINDGHKLVKQFPARLWEYW